jgi:hypothetical protein
MNQALHRLGFAAVTLCVALSGCAQPRTAPPGLVASPCTPGLCVVQVFVDNCTAPNGIRVDKPLVVADSAINMRWQIMTPAFVFASGGIVFDPPNPQFELRHNPTPTEFRIHNKKSQAGDFKYTVNVQGCTPHDPWVRNR